MEINRKRTTSNLDSFIPIYYQLFKHFEGLILSGELASGDMLPTEMEFPEHLGISRMTVRRVTDPKPVPYSVTGSNLWVIM